MTAPFPSPLSSDDLNKYFPAQRDPIAPNTFEIGLTLAGTVSAGAYTAGVLDYLFEALDAWTRAKEEREPEAPLHNVVISTIAGASGGGDNGAIFLRAASWEFPHGPVKGNPFYDLWVNGVDLEKLLDPSNDGPGFNELFNTNAFTTLADGIVGWKGAPLGSKTSPKCRSYLSDPLRLTITVANVTGVPYRILFRGQSNLSHDLLAHADWVRFGLVVDGGVPNAPVMRPDEFALSPSSELNWDSLKSAALSTCAFPAAFRSRPLRRAWEMLGYRVAIVPGQKPGTSEVAQLVPTWSAMNEQGDVPGFYRTVNVDGGTLNNEPFDIVRMALSGIDGRNPRQGDSAHRGVVMVDPFSDPEAISVYDPPNFVKLLGPLVSTLVQQARFKPEDIALAKDYDTYSRFLVAPVGPKWDGTETAGSNAIASGGLGGFLGFLDRRFLDYDFRLGRRNAYDFLRTELVLPEDNILFAGLWNKTQRADQGHDDINPATRVQSRFLPIVPLMKALRDNPPPMPSVKDWPKLPALPGKLPDQVEQRLNALFQGLKSDVLDASWGRGLKSGLLNLVWSSFLRGVARDGFVNAFTKALQQQHLL